MAKSSPTLHQPPRTARPDELAEENRRTEEALAEELAEEALRLRAPSGFILEPKSELALEAEAYQKSRNELVNGVTLLERSWAPTTPVEVVAAFQVMAEWVARVEEELDELQIGRVAELERRLALLEQRLDPDTDYRPAGLRYDGRLVSFDDEDREDPLAMLWANHHEPDGTRSAPKGGVMDEPLDDIKNGHLRPHTWAQMCDALSEIAKATYSVFEDVLEIQELRTKGS